MPLTPIQLTEICELQSLILNLMKEELISIKQDDKYSFSLARDLYDNFVLSTDGNVYQKKDLLKALDKSEEECTKLTISFIAKNNQCIQLKDLKEKPDSFKQLIVDSELTVILSKLNPQYILNYVAPNLDSLSNIQEAKKNYNHERLYRALKMNTNRLGLASSIYSFAEPAVPHLIGLTYLNKFSAHLFALGPNVSILSLLINEDLKVLQLLQKKLAEPDENEERNKILNTWIEEITNNINAANCYLKNLKKIVRVISQSIDNCTEEYNKILSDFNEEESKKRIHLLQAQIEEAERYNKNINHVFKYIKLVAQFGSALLLTSALTASYCISCWALVHLILLLPLPPFISIPVLVLLGIALGFVPIIIITSLTPLADKIVSGVLYLISKIDNLMDSLMNRFFKDHSSLNQQKTTLETHITLKKEFDPKNASIISTIVSELNKLIDRSIQQNDVSQLIKRDPVKLSSIPSSSSKNSMFSQGSSGSSNSSCSPSRFNTNNIEDPADKKNELNFN